MGVYLAMTELELRRCPKASAACAWLACHFSSADSGLSNMPSHLPQNGMLCVDDSLLPQGHDPERIAQQILVLYEQFSLKGVILDFQREYLPALADIARVLQSVVPCPMGITPQYAENWEGAVFLPPVPLNQPVCDYVSPWKGRELWLELSSERLSMILTEEGCVCSATGDSLQNPSFQDSILHCHYCSKLTETSASFTLERTWEDILELIEDAGQYGVTNAIGLYQEFGSICPP